MAPLRAIHFALGLIAAFGELGLHVRAGAHTGECEFVDGRLMGDAPHIAEQIAANAARGEIWTSRTTRDLFYGAGIEFEQRKAAAPGDNGQQWSLFKVRSKINDLKI